MWKKAMFAVVCMVLSMSGLAHAQGQTAAMIVSSADLSLGFDQPMHDRLAALGYEVTIVTSSEVGSGFTIDEANTYDLLLVSESIGSSSADPLIGTTTPVMHNESYGWDNWSLTTGANMHWATGASVDIVNDAHPVVTMARVQVGPMAFFTSSASWTTDSVSALAPGAELIAQITDAGTDCALVFVVDEGAQLANGNPALNRIAGFSIPGNNVYDASGMTNEAWALFDATIRWLTRSVLPTVAKAPSPADTATDVPRDVVLGWDPGESADTHDVYLGTSFDDVNEASRADPRGVLVGSGHDANSYAPGLLEYDTTYYWRIDEVNAPPDATIFKGPVWSFATEPYAYPVENVVAMSNGGSDTSPQKTVYGSGLNEAGQHSTEPSDMWLATPAEGQALWIQYEFEKVVKLYQLLVWNYNVVFEPVLGFGVKDVTIEYSVDGQEWTVLGDAELAQATARSDYEANTIVDMGGVAAQYVRLTVDIDNGYGIMGQYGLSEVRFIYIPAQAREPQPADGAGDVDPARTLTWRAGREAASHEVYLGTDPNALPLATTVDQASYTPDNLEFGSMYYWQIVEVNEADETPAWGGDVWSFSTQECALIDGFETYNDDLDAGTAIFDTWLDGWVNETGATVGYFDAPFAEKAIVRSGGQSMPIQYDNTTAPFYSEAERTFETAQDWTGNGADTLVLYVRGNAPDFVEAANGDIVMSGIGTDIWDTTDQFRYAYKSLSGNGSLTVRVDTIVRSNEWAKAGVMIRETLEPGSKHAFSALTPEPAHGASFQRRPATGQDSANTDVADVELSHWVRLTRTGNLFTMQRSADGVTWVDVTPLAPVEIPMNADVYIGLAVCSHDTAIATAAEMSNVSTTGNVSGAWQTAEIGVAQPVGNSSESMYVTIEDASGGSATVVNPDEAITVRPTWQEWAIPYADLAGVNVSRVQKMTIGVGSATGPSAGGTGTVYIDDIGFGRPAGAE